MTKLKSNQQGIALFISLVLLLVLTIVGVSSVQSTSLEVRMARNAHDSALAFQAAEAALRQAEQVVEAGLVEANFTDAGTNGLWTVAPFGQTPRWEDNSIWSGGTSAVVGQQIVGVSAQPRYIIEFVAAVQRPSNAIDIQTQTEANVRTFNIFRITARGVGGSDNAQVLLQSSYGSEV